MLLASFSFDFKCKFIFRQAVLFEHLLHNGDVGGNIHSVRLEELIQLLFVAIAELVQNAADLCFCLADGIGLDSLGLQPGVGFQRFQGLGR